MKKGIKKKRIGLKEVLLILIFFVVGYFTIIVLDTGYPLCFSQEYRKIEDVENIVFRQWQDNYYRRFFWGLGTVKEPENLSRNEVSAEEIEVLEDEIGEKNDIWQAIYSPDGDYILYCEIEWGARGTELTDDEHCYYRVYNMNTGEIVTIYDAYMEWYELYWK